MTRRRVAQQDGGQSEGVPEVGELVETGPAETVTATWGKELFSPKSFHTYEVGPFTATTALRRGETHAQATERLMRDLEKVAEAERDRKRESYLRSVGERK